MAESWSTSSSSCSNNPLERETGRERKRKGGNNEGRKERTYHLPDKIVDVCQFDNTISDRIHHTIDSDLSSAGNGPHAPVRITNR